MKRIVPDKNRAWLVQWKPNWFEEVFLGVCDRFEVDATHPEWIDKVLKPMIEKGKKIKIKRVMKNENGPAPTVATDNSGETEQWISVKNRLPEHLEKVLVVYEDSDNILMASYKNGLTGKDFYVYYADGRKPTHTPVTHWRSLPKPPR